MLWFNFILGLNFISLGSKLIIIDYHTPKQRKTKFKPRIKLNHNIYNYIHLIYTYIYRLHTFYVPMYTYKLPYIHLIYKYIHFIYTLYTNLYTSYRGYYTVGRRYEFYFRVAKRR